MWHQKKFRMPNITNYCSNFKTSNYKDNANSPLHQLYIAEKYPAVSPYWGFRLTHCYIKVSVPMSSHDGLYRQTLISKVSAKNVREDPAYLRIILLFLYSDEVNLKNTIYVYIKAKTAKGFTRASTDMH